MSQQLTVSHKGFDLPVEIHVPADGTRHAALVLIHDQWGMDDFTRAAAIRLAESGYAVVVPDLFARSGTPADDSEVARQDFLFALPDSQVIGDALAASNFLITLSGADKNTMGVVGWGWGGAFALLLAAHDARIRAAADIGGDITYPAFSANRPGSPLNFVAEIEGALFAAFPEHDIQPTVEVSRLRERMIEHDKIGEVKVFAGTTGRFWREDTPQAALLWRRLEQFLATSFDLPESAIFVDAGKAHEASRLHV